MTVYEMPGHGWDSDGRVGPESALNSARVGVPPHPIHAGHMPAYVPLGPQVRIRAYRELAVGSVADLIERIEEHGVRVSPDHLRACEIGHQRPSQRLLTAWSLALGLDPFHVWLPDSEPIELHDESVA